MPALPPMLDAHMANDTALYPSSRTESDNDSISSKDRTFISSFVVAVLRLGSFIACSPFGKRFDQIASQIPVAVAGCHRK